MIHYYGYGFGFLDLFFMIIHWALIAIVIYFIVKFIMNSSCSTKSYNHEHKQNQALEILKERFAKGEIDKAEFEEKKKILE